MQTGDIGALRRRPVAPPQVIARIGPNELVGEMALIGDEHHSATVTVSSGPAEILVVQADDLRLQAAIYDSDHSATSRSADGPAW